MAVQKFEESKIRFLSAKSDTCTLYMGNISEDWVTEGSFIESASVCVFA